MPNSLCENSSLNFFLLLLLLASDIFLVYFFIFCVGDFYSIFYFSICPLLGEGKDHLFAAAAGRLLTVSSIYMGLRCGVYMRENKN